MTLQDLFTSLRFQLTGLLCSSHGLDGWSSFADEEFARALYVEVRRLQKERDAAVATVERVTTALQVPDTGFYSSNDE